MVSQWIAKKSRGAWKRSRDDARGFASRIGLGLFLQHEGRSNPLFQAAHRLSRFPENRLPWSKRWEP